MLKKILLALIFVITAITNVAHAEDDMKTVASKAYVDTKIETKQLKIPAANTPGVGAGETVMTYTATGNGQIGERGLYSDISSYNATTDGDKLITASALNATFTNLPTTGTTKLECANESDGCTLWTIVDQTAYHKPSRNLFDENLFLNANNWAVSDGVYTGTPDGLFVLYGVSTSGFPISFKPSTQYTIKYTVSQGSGVAGSRFRVYYTDNTYSDGHLPGSGVGGTYTITTTAGKTVAKLTFAYTQGTNNISFSNVMLEEGSTATPYEPYY